MVIELLENELRVKGEPLDTLRKATGGGLDRYDESVDLSSLIRSRSRYREFLVRLFGFYVAAEELLDNSLNCVAKEDLETVRRKKTPLLLLDLIGLGLTKSDVDCAQICSDLPAVSSVQQAVGVLYVLEEATVGGEFISQLLNQRLAIPPEKGSRFYQGHGRRTTAMWNHFRTVLSTFAADESQRKEVIEAAAETFDKLTNWIEAQPALPDQKCG